MLYEVITVVIILKTKTKPKKEDLLAVLKILLYLPSTNVGGLAQLARAFDWQSKGHRFDSGILHLTIKELQI